MPPKPMKYFVGMDGRGIRHGDMVKDWRHGWGVNERVDRGPFRMEVFDVENQDDTDRFVLRDMQGGMVTSGRGEAMYPHNMIPDGRYEMWVPFSLAFRKRTAKKLDADIKGRKALVRDRLRGDLPASERLALASTSLSVSSQQRVNSIAQAIDESCSVRDRGPDREDERDAHCRLTRACSRPGHYRDFSHVKKITAGFTKI